MTVCVAAICQLKSLPIIIGASDRMLTVGDTVEYEPPQPKLYTMTDKAIVMIAGDTSSQWTVGQMAQRQVIDRKVTSIAEMAQIYAKAFAFHRLRIAESQILTPLGLTVASFQEKQKDMSPDLVDALTARMTRNRLMAEAIIAGIDDSGAHIFTIHDPGVELCQDREGFAAIGIGADHALSQFMFAKYFPLRDFSEALPLLYSAKKRAEVAPGVGEETDMFFIEPGSPANLLQGEIRDLVEALYQETRAKIDAVHAESRKKVDELIENYLKKLAENAAKQEKETPPTAG